MCKKLSLLGLMCSSNAILYSIERPVPIRRSFSAGRIRSLREMILACDLSLFPHDVLLSKRLKEFGFSWSQLRFSVRILNRD